jgi:hypothetical protein
MPHRKEVWVVIRRHNLRTDGSKCPACGLSAFHELMGVGMQDGDISAEEMARGLCTDENEYIGPLPANVSLGTDACILPGSYYPLTGEMVGANVNSSDDVINQPSE